MARHHNGRHPQRGRSHYRDRLEKRGLSKAPLMEKVENLRAKQLARQQRTGSLWPSERSDTEEQAA